MKKAIIVVLCAVLSSIAVLAPLINPQILTVIPVCGDHYILEETVEVQLLE